MKLLLAVLVACLIPAGAVFLAHGAFLLSSRFTWYGLALVAVGFLVLAYMTRS